MAHLGRATEQPRFEHAAGCRIDDRDVAGLGIGDDQPPAVGRFRQITGKASYRDLEPLRARRDVENRHAVGHRVGDRQPAAIGRQGHAHRLEAGRQTADYLPLLDVDDIHRVVVKARDKQCLPIR